LVFHDRLFHVLRQESTTQVLLCVCTFVNKKRESESNGGAASFFCFKIGFGFLCLTTSGISSSLSLPSFQQSSLQLLLFLENKTIETPIQKNVQQKKNKKQAKQIKVKYIGIGRIERSDCCCLLCFPPQI